MGTEYGFLNKISSSIPKGSQKSTVSASFAQVLFKTNRFKAEFFGTWKLYTEIFVNISCSVQQSDPIINKCVFSVA